jgi:hypothetical protein
MWLKTENSRRVAKSRPVCIDLYAYVTYLKITGTTEYFNKI